MNRINPAKTADLLNELAKGAKCFYLSDLHDASKAADVVSALDTIQWERFSMEEWREVVRYTLRTEDVQGEDIPGMIAFLKARLTGEQ